VRTGPAAAAEEATAAAMAGRASAGQGEGEAETAAVREAADLAAAEGLATGRAGTP